MKNNILPFNTPRVPAEKRIGPHNFIILSIIIGSLLGVGSILLNTSPITNYLISLFYFSVTPKRNSNSSFVKLFTI